MRKTRLAAGLASSMGLSALIIAPLAAPAYAVDCATPTPVKIISFTDFHGRIAPSSPDTSVFFANIEANRDDNTVVLANGDSIGASLFPSMILNDEPTLDILNALEIDASSVGNHELDKGYADFTGRVLASADFPYVSANLTNIGDNSPVADAPYTIATTANGVTVGIIGAITEDLPSLISPEFFNSGQVDPAVAAVNDYAAQLKDGDATNGEADIVIAAYHEGSSANSAFSADVDVIVNGHTHESLAQIDATGRPVIQPAQYGGQFGVTEVSVDTDDNTVCEVVRNENVSGALPAGEDRAAFIANSPRSIAIDSIVTSTLAAAAEAGAPIIATATAPISRGVTVDGALDNRAVESTMSNLVAQMFHDQLGAGDPNFIGVQNAGGTRADFDAGEVSVGEAAAVLPFANTLMTTQLTGAQVKTMLEQQWQPDPTSRRPFLSLGLSDNVSYTYDESRPAGQRILNVFINGAPIDPAALYTVGSGSFLIAGGDNFSVIGEGINDTDTGRADLEAWVEWIEQQGTLTPDYSKRGVQFTGTTDVDVTVPVEWIVGQPVAGSLTNQTLDMQALGAPANTTLVAHVGSPTGPEAGTAQVTNGSAVVSLNLPNNTAAGPNHIYLVADQGTVVIVGVNVINNHVPVVAQRPTNLPRTGVAR